MSRSSTRSSTPSSTEGELRRWWQEHSDLDHLVEALVETIGRESIAAAQAALEDLAEAMDSHLSVEEEGYFPLVEKLSPEHISVLRQVRLAHLEIRGDLDRLGDYLTRGDLAAARELLIALLKRFRDHEETEARLISDLEGRPSA